MEASFYDISNIVFSYQKGFSLKSDIIPLYKDKKLIKQYIIEKNMNFGDIIFIGGDGDRQEYYFAFVIENGEYIQGEYGPYIIFQKQYEKYLEKIKNKNISYQNVFNELNNNEYYRDLFFGYDDYTIYDSCIKKYEDNNLM